MWQWKVLSFAENLRDYIFSFFPVNVVVSYHDNKIKKLEEEIKKLEKKLEK
jgi:hypothetical protein